MLWPPVRQAGKGVAQPFELRMLVAEHAMVVQRADRQLVRIVGPDGEAARLRSNGARVAGFKDGAILIAKERHQQLVAQIASVRVPIDVEPTCVVGCWAPFQHVEPQRIVGTADAHVVGHEIEHLAEAAARNAVTMARKPPRRRAPG